MLTVDRQAIENSGFHNLLQLMEMLPVNGNGAASISLPGLGADATLVLVTAAASRSVPSRRA